MTNDEKAARNRESVKEWRKKNPEKLKEQRKMSYFRKQHKEYLKKKAGV